LVGLGSKSVAPLTQALGDENLRGPAAVALAQIGPPAASAIKALTDALADKNAPVRAMLLDALAVIAPNNPQVLATLTQFSASDPDAGVRQAAIVGLETIGVGARSALEAATRDRDPVVANAARDALARLPVR
jgi:HEAT repeat protein